MDLNTFLTYLKYKPVWVSEPSNIDDGVQNIEFRRLKNHTASIEFGRNFNVDKNGYYFYYEIIDWNNYNDGDFIALDSSRRHDVILYWPKLDDEYKKLAEKINESLKRHYRR
jgi:hypothetical protein